MGGLAALGGYLFSGRDPFYKARLITGMASALLADTELRQDLCDARAAC